MEHYITKFIPYNKANAITRQELMNITGLSDRAVRREIETARKDGVPILSSSKGSGYWLSDDVEELKKYITENDNRIRNLYLTNRKLKQWLYEKKGIKTVKVREHERRVSGGV